MLVNPESYSQSLVSIIIPCYNQASFLDETFASILAQVHSNWEALIIDDGSTDNTGQISRDWCAKDERFKYFLKENGGLSDARNYGINRSSGEFIQFLDSDDLISPDKLVLQIAALEHNGADISICTSEFFRDDNYHNRYINNFGLDIVPNKIVAGTDLFELFLTNNRFPVSAPLLRSKTVLDLGLFDVQLRSLEDWEYWFRLLLKNKTFSLDFTERPHTYIRVRGNSMSTNRTTMTLSRIVVYNHLLQVNNPMIDLHRHAIEFYIYDNIKQYLYEINRSMNYRELFHRLEQKIAVPLRYRIYKLFFSFNIISHTRLLWLVFDFSPRSLFNLFQLRRRANVK